MSSLIFYLCMLFQIIFECSVYGVLEDFVKSFLILYLSFQFFLQLCCYSLFLCKIFLYSEVIRAQLSPIFPVF